LPGTNALAYYKNPLITSVKSFIVQAPGGSTDPGYLLKNDKIDNNSVAILARKYKEINDLISFNLFYTETILFDTIYLIYNLKLFNVI
jgi:hypothetical protein